MLRNMTRRFCRPGLLALAAAFAFIAVGVLPVQAQTINKVSSTPQISQPLFREYRGVTIGMSTDEARAKLGVPKETSAAQDYYARSESEFVQVIYDGTQKVKIIAITYVGEANAPSCKEVLGEEVEAADDGAIKKLVRYPGAGYSVSYYRTGGTDPLITVTIQKFKE